MNTLCVCFHGFVVMLKTDAQSGQLVYGCFDIIYRKIKDIFFTRRFHLFHVIFSFFICHTLIPVARNSTLAQKAIRRRKSCPSSFACDSVQP